MTPAERLVAVRDVLRGHIARESTKVGDYVKLYFDDRTWHGVVLQVGDAGISVKWYRITHPDDVPRHAIGTLFWDDVINDARQLQRDLDPPLTLDTPTRPWP